MRASSRAAACRVGAGALRPDALDRFGAFCDALRWSSIARLPGLTSDDAALISPWESAVHPEPYQLVPVLKAGDCAASLLACSTFSQEPWASPARSSARRQARELLFIEAARACPRGPARGWRRLPTLW